LEAFLRKRSVLDGMVKEGDGFGELEVDDDVGAGAEAAFGIVDVNFGKERAKK